MLSNDALVELNFSLGTTIIVILVGEEDIISYQLENSKISLFFVEVGLICC